MSQRSIHHTVDAMDLNTRNIENTIDKPIVLVGMMGSGKTHLGKMLAEALSLEFFDTDHVIEERGNLSINEIFELYGEERFRQSEEKVIIELLGQGACIIATGGGAPTNPKILSAIKEQSISIWLNSEVEEIFERIKHAKNRPLLNKANPKAILKDLIKKRIPLYATADITIETKGNNADKALSEMIEAINDIR